VIRWLFCSRNGSRSRCRVHGRGSIANDEQAKLKRVLTFWDVFFIALGQIIGAGVIALTGVAIGMTGPSVILAYLLAAALVIMVSVLIVFAGATLPTVGAFYAWPARLCNGWVGSIVLILIALASISLSLFGSAVGLYLNPLFPVLSVNMWGVVVIFVIFLANLLGLEMASRLQMGLVLVLLSALGVYVGFAMPQIDMAHLSPMFPKGVVGFLTAAFLVKFATGGASLIVGLAGEMINPRRTIPLVIFGATTLVAVVYGLVALASVGVLFHCGWRRARDLYNAQRPVHPAAEKFHRRELGQSDSRLGWAAEPLWRAAHHLVRHARHRGPAPGRRSGYRSNRPSGHDFGEPAEFLSLLGRHSHSRTLPPRLRTIHVQARSELDLGFFRVVTDQHSRRRHLVGAEPVWPGTRYSRWLGRPGARLLPDQASDFATKRLRSRCFNGEPGPLECLELERTGH